MYTHAYILKHMHVMGVLVCFPIGHNECKWKEEVFHQMPWLPEVLAGCQ